MRPSPTDEDPSQAGARIRPLRQARRLHPAGQTDGVEPLQDLLAAQSPRHRSASLVRAARARAARACRRAASTNATRATRKAAPSAYRAALQPHSHPARHASPEHSGPSSRRRGRQVQLEDHASLGSSSVHVLLPRSSVRKSAGLKQSLKSPSSSLNDSSTSVSAPHT